MSSLIISIYFNLQFQHVLRSAAITDDGYIGEHTYVPQSEAECRLLKDVVTGYLGYATLQDQTLVDWIDDPKIVNFLDLSDDGKKSILRLPRQTVYDQYLAADPSDLDDLVAGKPFNTVNKDYPLRDGPLFNKPL